MGFGNISSDAGLTVLDSFLEEHSYIDGYTASQADTAVFEELKEIPSNDKYPHAARWYRHIESFGKSISSLPGTKKAISSYGPTDSSPNGTKLHKLPADVVPTRPDTPSKSPVKPVEDDVDLFGSDDEEDVEAERIKAERLAEYNAKKATKPKVIAKSMVILDVKPWDDETDMNDVEKGVRAIQMDGLVWGVGKLVPVAHGIKKLQITCVVEDDKVGVDDLSEEIQKMEDLVQSVDVAAFNKL
jgi:elongation factor 1-beta